MQQQRCACEQTAALLALPALCLVVAAEEDIHLSVAHPPVGHWHDVLLQAGAVWVNMTHASLQPAASGRETSGHLKFAPAPSNTGMALLAALLHSDCAPILVHPRSAWCGARNGWDPRFRTLTGTLVLRGHRSNPRNPTAHRTEAPTARSNSWCSALSFKNFTPASPGLYTGRCAAPWSCWCSCAHPGDRCRRAAWQASSTLEWGVERGPGGLLTALGPIHTGCRQTHPAMHLRSVQRNHRQLFALINIRVSRLKSMLPAHPAVPAAEPVLASLGCCTAPHCSMQGKRGAQLTWSGLSTRPRAQSSGLAQVRSQPQTTPL